VDDQEMRNVENVAADADKIDTTELIVGNEVEEEGDDDDDDDDVMEDTASSSQGTGTDAAANLETEDGGGDSENIVADESSAALGRKSTRKGKGKKKPGLKVQAKRQKRRELFWQKKQQDLLKK